MGELFKMVILWAHISRLDWDQMVREALARSEAAPEVTEEDTNLEHLLEDEDISFAEETQAINTGRANHDQHSAEAIVSSMKAGSPSPFIGSRSPKFLRKID